MRKNKTLSLVVLGALTALNIVLTQILGLHIWNMKVGFGFLTIFVAACLFGPVGGATVAILGDILGYFVNPVGAFFPAFTLTAFCIGVMHGFFFKRSVTPLKIVAVTLIEQGIFSLLVNTYWISVLYGTPMAALFSTRLIQVGIMVPLEIVMLFVFKKYVIIWRKMIEEA